jgi:tetratricopeptide (TPR) repeat protein
MAWRFRKSISLGKGLKLNISKKSFGFSAGTKGFHFGINSSKGAYNSFGIPGTGLYSVNYQGGGTKPSRGTKPSNGVPTNTIGCLALIPIALCVMLIAILPQLGIAALIILLVVYVIWVTRPKQRAMQKLLKAKNYLSEHKYVEAINLLLEANKLDNNNLEVICLLGGVLHDSEKYNEAIEYLNKYLAVFPNSVAIQIVLADCFYNIKQFDDAIRILQKLPESPEPDLKAIQLLGACFAEQKNYDLAIDVYKKAPLLKRKLDDNLIELHYNLALIYERSGDKANALKHFKRVFAENINYRDVAKKIESLEK